LNLGVWLRLGRVSNLPTVWSNVLAALALSGGLTFSPAVAWLCGIFSLYYVAGMYLNDAFDREIDKRERPTRPIPSGQVSAGLVFTLGFAALFVATLLLLLVARGNGASVYRAASSGAALAALIVAYDMYHKQNPLSPLLMGSCRVMVYVAAAYAVGEVLRHEVMWGALVLWCYLIGLTYAAKQEAKGRLTRLWPLAFLAAPVGYGMQLALGEPLVWPWLLAFALWAIYALSFLRPGPRRSVPQGVVRLIAGISLLDALLIASTGSATWALVAVLLCSAARIFQRYIPGT
jgi:4-hydroxybenzoate polyprenyltransferase